MTSFARVRIAPLCWLASVVVLLGGCATQTAPPGPAAADVPMAATPAASAPVAVMPSAPAASQPAAPPTTATAETGPAPAVVDPLRPDVRIDPDDADARMDLWTRVRRGFAMADLDTSHVRKSEQWYATRPDYVARMTERSSRYLFHIVEEVERRGLPTELALLPFIESAFNPEAMSTAKASGMWQFIPSTGRHFELTQNIFRDDRRDVLASTRAALDYLQKLHAMFDDWHLALAAYNWGEGSVQRAIARNQKAGKPTDYLSLRMPEETRYYVPKLQAVKNIIARPESFGLQLPSVENHPYFLSVPIERDIDVDLAARLAGMQMDEFKTLNPQMNRPVILAAGTPQVLLPYDNANLFVRNFSGHRGPLASWTAWVAPTTLRPADAAKRVGMTEAQLREVNRHPCPHAGACRLDARRAARPGPRGRRVRAHRRSRDDRAGARWAGAAARLVHGRQARFDGLGDCAAVQGVAHLRRRLEQGRPASHVQAGASGDRLRAEQGGAVGTTPRGQRRGLLQSPARTNSSSHSASSVSGDRRARARWCSGRRTRARCRPEHRAPSA